VIICDTSGLLAAYDAEEPEGPAIRQMLDAEAGALVVSPFVLAELDYVLLTRAGVRAELTLLNDLASDVYHVAVFTSQDAGRAARLVEQYADLKLGIADAHTMILAAADRYGTTRILTFDQKHFRAVKPLQGGVFTLLPADL
jgi:predicted nucleic acid-binding protein